MLSLIILSSCLKRYTVHTVVRIVAAGITQQKTRINEKKQEIIKQKKKKKVITAAASSKQCGRKRGKGEKEHGTAHAEYTRTHIYTYTI